MNKNKHNLNKKNSNKHSINKTKKTNNQNRKSKLKVIKKIILVFMLICILLCLIGAGVFAGIFFSDKFAMSKEDLLISNSNTFVYDSEGNLIRELSGDENRKIISLNDMPDYLPKAFIAIEDERFYEHHGVDIKRTGAATVTYIFNKGSSSFGGSTITQQLIKNITNEKDDEGTAGIQRKIKEMSRAYQIEKIISKSQILELYLNIIYLGGYGKNICGVEVASEYYFSKSAKDLTIAESAFLAGINHSPNNYNPFTETDNNEKIKKRTKTVLVKMKELKMIDEEQYNKAIEEVDAGLKFTEGKSSNAADMSYHLAAAIDQVINQMVEEKGMSYEYAKSRLYSGGYRLYTTEVSSIQDRMEEEYLKDKYIIKSKENAGQHSQSAMVIIDYKTGNVVGCVGGLGNDVNALGLNRINSPRQPGSSIKPLAAIAPSLEKGIITAGTVYDDSPTTFGNYPPKNSTGYRGLITVRKAIEVSSNVVEVKIMSELGPENSINFLKQLGLSHLDDKKDNGLSLVLGGMTNGATTLEMAAAYATIANNGEYITPTFYTKLVDMQGKTVLEPKQERRRVMSEGTAYITKSILKAPVVGPNGTATNCTISGMEVGAKTGTTDSNKDKWLCGITPYYAAATWFGFDEPEYINYSGNPSAKIWAAIMKDIHKDLEKQNFEKPTNIVTARICKDSGKSATGSCSNTYTEEFVSGTVPAACDGHSRQRICKDSGKLANEFCTNVQEKSVLKQPEKERDASWKTSSGGKYSKVKDTCDIHKEAPSKEEPKEPEETEKPENEKKPEDNSNKNEIDNSGSNDDVIIKKVIVPNVVGRSESEAKMALQTVNLRYKIVYGNDPEKENGVVLKQSKKATEEVKEDTIVTLTINKKSESSNKNEIQNLTNTIEN